MIKSNNVTEINQDPIKNFKPGHEEDTTQKVKNLANMVGMDTSNTFQTQPNPDEMKKELTDKIVKGVNEGKTSDEIMNELLVNMPDGEPKEKMKESMKPILEQSIEQMKNNSFNQENVQQKIQEMIFEVINKGRTVEEVIDEFISTIPDDPSVDKNKIKSDLTIMMNQAIDAYKQTTTNNNSSEVNKIDLDPWKHRTDHMKCKTCLWFVLKEVQNSRVGRCRRHAPTMNGYPVVFINDWCGDHKIDETKVI